MGKDSLIKSTAKSSEKKTVGPNTKNMFVKDLIFKKFDAWRPKALFTVSLDDQYLKDYAAPPIVSDMDEDEARRIKELLLRRFDLGATKDEDTAKMSIDDTKAEPEDESDAGKAQPVPTDAAFGPPIDTKVSDPVERAMKYAGVCFAVLVALVIAASISNRNGYYIKTTVGAIEIWQGLFAPMGSELIYRLSGMQPPEPVKDIYSKKEISQLVINYYIGKADALLDGPGMPDFEEIKSYLNKALLSGITDDHRKAVFTRLRNIDLMTLVYKADVAASRGTITDLEAAMGYLKKAASLELDESQARLIEQKTESVLNLKKAAEEKQGKASAKPAAAK